MALMSEERGMRIRLVAAVIVFVLSSVSVPAGAKKVGSNGFTESSAGVLSAIPRATSSRSFLHETLLGPGEEVSKSDVSEGRRMGVKLIRCKQVDLASDWNDGRLVKVTGSGWSRNARALTLAIFPKKPVDSKEDWIFPGDDDAMEISDEMGDVSDDESTPDDPDEPSLDEVVDEWKDKDNAWMSSTGAGADTEKTQQKWRKLRRLSNQARVLREISKDQGAPLADDEIARFFEATDGRKMKTGRLDQVFAKFNVKGIKRNVAKDSKAALVPLLNSTNTINNASKDEGASRAVKVLAMGLRGSKAIPKESLVSLVNKLFKDNFWKPEGRSVNSENKPNGGRVIPENKLSKEPEFVKEWRPLIVLEIRHVSAANFPGLKGGEDSNENPGSGPRQRPNKKPSERPNELSEFSPEGLPSESLVEIGQNDTPAHKPDPQPDNRPHVPQTGDSDGNTGSGPNEKPSEKPNEEASPGVMSGSFRVTKQDGTELMAKPVPLPFMSPDRGFMIVIMRTRLGFEFEIFGWTTEGSKSMWKSVRIDPIHVEGPPPRFVKVSESAEVKTLRYYISTDMIPDTKECQDVVENRDCVTGEWTEWTPCTTSCGIGEMFRVRSVDLPAVGNGKCDIATSDVEYCNVDNSCSEFAVDCEVSEWGEWGVCSETCGTGVKERTRTVVTEATGAGIGCPPLQHTNPCYNGPCL